MAGKFVIKDINSEEQFSDLIEAENKNGAPSTAPGGLGGTIATGRLLIVDLYHQWYGPCAAIAPTFKTLAMNTDFFDARALLTQMELSVVPEMLEKFSPEKEGEDGAAEAAPEPAAPISFGAKAAGGGAPVKCPQPLGKPKFLFYKDGKRVGEVMGINAPEILRLVEEHMPEFTPDEAD